MTEGELPGATQISLAIISGVLSLFGTIVTGVVGYYMAKLSKQQNLAAVEVATVKTDLKKSEEAAKSDVKETRVKLDALADVGAKTHTLVNSNMGAQLRLNTIASRRLADLTKDPVDLEAAKLAENLLAEHEKKQAVVDDAMVRAAVELAKPPGSPGTQQIEGTVTLTPK